MLDPEMENDIKDLLIPLFENIGSRLQDLEEDLCETKDAVYKIICGMYDGVQSYKRSGLQEMIGGQYGEELGPYDELLTGTRGKSLTDEITDAFMEGEIPDEGRDEFIKSRLEEAKGKYGNFIKPKEAAVTIETTPEEHEAGETPKKEEIEEEAAGGGGTGSPLLDDMISTLAGKKK